MKKLYNILFIFGLLCTVPAFSMQEEQPVNKEQKTWAKVTYWTDYLHDLVDRYLFSPAKDRLGSPLRPADRNSSYWNYMLGFATNLYPYKTWYGAIGCNIGAICIRKGSFMSMNNKFSNVEEKSKQQFALGAVAGWTAKKIAPYVWSTIKKLRK